MGKDRVILERRYVPKGSLIIEQGDEAYSAFLIQSGRVSVYYEQDGKTVELAQLGMGQICGEMALLHDEPEERSASVRALEDCNLIVITYGTFKEKLEKSDPTIKAVVEMLVRRVEAGNQEVLNQKSDIPSLIVAITKTYDNVVKGLKEKEQKRFIEKVQPKLDALLQALKSFTSK